MNVAADPDAAAERVPLAEVRDLICVGQPLPVRVLDVQGRLLLNAGRTLVDEAQYEALLERGAWAERDRVEAARSALVATPVEARSEAVLMPTLFDAWERLLWQLDKLARAIVRDLAPASAIQPLFDSVLALTDRDPDVALFLCVRPDGRRFALYALTHSIHCTVAAVLAGRMLRWSEQRVRSVGCAALTMNLSMLELQALMADQDTPPTARQREQIRGHPEASVKLLRAGGIVDEEWLTAVLQHHEHHGGGGYPQGLTEVEAAAKLLRAADVYMAKISPRAKRPPMAPQLAMRQLFQEQPGDPLAMALVRSLGVHPPGSLVQLRSGEVAVATRRPVTGTQPLVATLSDRQGRPISQTHQRNTAEPEFAVLGPLQDAQLYPRVLPERVYGLIAV